MSGTLFSWSLEAIIEFVVFYSFYASRMFWLIGWKVSIIKKLLAKARNFSVLETSVCFIWTIYIFFIGVLDISTFREVQEMKQHFERNMQALMNQVCAATGNELGNSVASSSSTPRKNVVTPECPVALRPLPTCQLFVFRF